MSHIKRLAYLLRKTKQSFREDGLLKTLGFLIRSLYSHALRKFVPITSKAVHSGIKLPLSADIPADLLHRPTDSIIPPIFPLYKELNCRFLANCCKKGDTVVIIGGGHGVTATKAAVCVGRGGNILAYEGSPNRASLLKKTLSINGVDNWSQVINAVVGSNDFVVENSRKAVVISPKKIPPCHVIEIDCEGAELGILESLTSLPDYIVVETHPSNGSTISAITGKLSQYSLLDKAEDPHGGHVLCLKKRDG